MEQRNGPERHAQVHMAERFHLPAPVSSLPETGAAPGESPATAAAPLDNQHVAFVAPRTLAEFLGAPYQGAMGVNGGAADAAAPLHALGHLAPLGALPVLGVNSDGQMWPPASAPLRAGSGTTGLAGRAAAGGGDEIELPPHHDPAQMEVFWRLMGATGSGVPPQASLLEGLPLAVQLPLAPAFPMDLPLGMDFDPAQALEAVIKVEEVIGAAAQAEKVAQRRKQLREAQARARERKRQEEQEEVARKAVQLEAVRAQMAAAAAERAALLAVQREYCRHLAVRTAALNALDPVWHAKQRQSTTEAPWAAPSQPPPQPVALPRASGFGEIVKYARQYVLTVRMAVEDAFADGMDAGAVADVEAAVRGGLDPRTAFLQMASTRESFQKALAALKYERPQPCVEEARWAAAAAAVVGRCPPDALLRLRRVVVRAEERRKCVAAALERVARDLRPLLPAESAGEDGGALPCCWAAAAKEHLDVAALAAIMSSCCAEANRIYQDVADFFMKDLGLLATAFVIANCEPDWPNWLAVATRAEALAEQRGVIPPRSQPS